MLKCLLNWRYVVPRLAIAVIAVVATSYAIEPLVHKFLTALGERIMRSKVDIKRVDVALTTADVTITGAQVANPRSLDRNLIEFDSATLDIVTSSLFQRRVRVREARMTGVRFNTPRSKSANVDVGPGGIDVDLDANVRSLSTNALRQFARIIALDLQEDLVSIGLAQELSARWPEELQQLDAKVAAHNEQVQQLAKSLESSVRNPIGAATVYPEKVAEVERLRSEYYQLKDELDRIVEQSTRDREAIAIARRHDTGVIRRKLTLRPLDPQQLSQYLLGDELTQETEQMIRWIQLARRYWPSQVELPAADRQSGEDILFPGLKPMPSALIDRLCLEGTFPNGKSNVAWRGEIQNLTTDPAIVGQPMVIRVAAQGEQAIIIEATLDRTTSVARDHIVLSLPAIKQPARTLGNPEQLAIAISPGTMHLWADLHLEGEKLTGRMLVEQKELSLQTLLPASYGPRIAERVQATACACCDTLQAEIVLAGTLEKPSWQLRSNLGPQLAAHLTTTLNDELALRQQEIGVKLDQYLAGQQQQLDERLTAEREKVQLRLAAGSQDVDDLKRLVAGRIRLPGGNRRDDLPFSNPFHRR
jgi:uncharacterized protein (TIGR03545 family)